MSASLSTAVATAETTEGSEVTLSADDVRVWRQAPGNCGRSEYDLQADAAWTDWQADITVRNPRGKTVRTAVLTEDQSSASVKLCSSSGAGIYSVAAEWTAFDESGEVAASETVVTSFRLRVRDKVETTLTVDADHVRHGFWTIKGKLTGAGRAIRGAKVPIQAKYLGSWHNLKTKVTSRAGMVRYTSEPKPGAGKYPVRLRFNGDSHSKPSSSKTFRLYP